MTCQAGLQIFDSQNNIDDDAPHTTGDTDAQFIQCLNIKDCTLETVFKEQIQESMSDLDKEIDATGTANLNGGEVTLEDTYKRALLLCCDRLVWRAVEHAEYLSQRDAETRDNITTRLQSVLREVKSEVELNQDSQSPQLKRVRLEALEQVIGVICYPERVHNMLSSYRSSSRDYSPLTDDDGEVTPRAATPAPSLHEQ